LLLAPAGVNKIVLVSIPNSNTKYVIKNLQDRIKAHDGKINEKSESAYPRSRGSVQLIGADFWRTLRNLDPVKLLQEVVLQSKVIIFKPLHDDVLGPDYFDEYKKANNINYVELVGDHNFTDLSDRKNLIKKARLFLKN
jgi:hypothetical protein